MASRKQTRANRKNARLSTGPRTPDGKAASSRNALKHGLTSRRFLIRDDEREEFQELRDGLIAEYDPRGAHAWLLFEQALLAAWNLKRVARVEAELCENDTDPLSNPALHSQLQLLMRYHARHERSFYRALKELRAERVTTRPTTHAGARPSVASIPDNPDIAGVPELRPGMTADEIFEQLFAPEEFGEMAEMNRQHAERRERQSDELRI